jgi:hypothetical protein
MRGGNTRDQGADVRRGLKLYEPVRQHRDG